MSAPRTCAILRSGPSTNAPRWLMRWLCGCWSTGPTTACPSPRWGASWVWRSRRLPDSRPGAMSPRWQHWRALPEAWALSSTSTSRPQPLGCERRHDKPSLTVQPSRPLGGRCDRQGIRASLTVGLPAATSRRTLAGLPRSTHTRCGRGGCLLYPGDGGAHPIDHKSSTGACRFPAASPYTPLKQPINEAADNETSTEVHAIHPSGLALTCDPRMERGPSGLNSELRTPPSPAAHVRAGTGHRAPARNYATDISRPSCLRVHSQRATSCRNLKYCFTRLCR